MSRTKAARIPTVFLVVMCLVLASALALTGCRSETVQPHSSLDTPRLDSGPISGLQDGEIRYFLGIPYAAPPVGERRWKDPQPVEPWDEVRPCVAYGPACPQVGEDRVVSMKPGETSEDCLYLNVWTPARSPEDRLPVMVWIHGGAFKTGAGSLPLYDGSNLARRGVVVVTINYRLGPFGFLAHPLLSKESPNKTSGNYGLMDQVAALRWVQRNIGAFGGDAGNVTVFGESAGGMSILDLMCSPLAEGLFHRAIVESGPLLELGIPLNSMPTLDEAENQGLEFSRKLGCAGAEDELAALREVPPEKLLEAASGERELFSPIVMGPNIDGYFLPRSPVETFATGFQHRVPLLTGINADEGTLFAPELTVQQYRMMASYLYGQHAEEVMELFPASSEQEAQDAMQRFITQMGFSASARFTAECMEKEGVPSYLYHFTRLVKDPRARHLGSFHGLEIMYVFGNLDKVQATGLDDTDRALSEAMMSYWVNFARTGDPNGEGLPTWPAYDRETAPYQELGDAVATGTRLHEASYRLVMKINGMED